MGLLLNVGWSKNAFPLKQLVFCWHSHVLHIYFVKGGVQYFSWRGGNAQTNQNTFSGKQSRKKNKNKTRLGFGLHDKKKSMNF